MFKWNTAQKSMTGRLTVCMAAIMLVTVIFVSMASYFVAEKNILAETLEKNRQAATAGAWEISSWFESKKILIETIGYDIQALGDARLASSVIRAQAARHTDIAEMYMAFSDDSYFLANPGSVLPAGFRPTLRPWFSQALAAEGRTIVTSPYSSVTDQGMVITLAVNPGKTGPLDAVLGGDISMSHVASIILKMPVERGGYFFLADANGSIAVHPDPRFAATQDGLVSMAQEPAYARAMRSALNGEPSIKLQDYDGLVRYIMPCRIESTGWILYAAIPSDVILNYFNLEMGAIFTVCLLLTAAAALFIALLNKNLLSMSLAGIVRATGQVAEGNMDFKPRYEYIDAELQELYFNFSNMRLAVNELTDDLTKMSERHFAGDFEFKIDEKKYSGAFKNIVCGVNIMASMYVNNFMELFAVLENLGRGRFNVNIKRYPGKMEAWNHSMETFRANLSGITQEINKLATAAVEGNLSVRANAAVFSGDWARLLGQLNKVMESIASPVRDSSVALLEMSQGRLGARIVSDCKGDFLIMKNALNTTLYALSSYITEISMVLKKVSDDDLGTEITGEYIGEFRGIKDSINMIIYKLNDITGDMLDSLRQFGVMEDEQRPLREGASAAKAYGPAGVKGLTGKFLMLAQGVNKAMTIIDNIDSCVYVSDLNTYEILFANRKLAEELGVGLDALLNKACWQVLQKGMSGPCPFCPVFSLMSSKDPLPCSELELYNDKLDRWFLSKNSIIRWIDGRPVHFAVARDITDRKRYEEKREMQEQSLREAVVAAEEASRTKSAFLANMSHEIRTPLNGVIGFADLALDDERISEKAREYLSKIKICAESLLQIISDILDISKIEAGKIELEHIPFSLQEVFAACATISAPKAREKGLALRLNADSVVKNRLLGDPAKLRQALLNLLSNAVKFTNAGEVELNARVLAMRRDKASIYFEVRDSGIGMTLEQSRKALEPFMQADSGATREYGGAGLGLSITKSIIEMMGGKLDMASEPERGSVFSFTLMFEMLDEADGITLIEAERPPANGKPVFAGRVLVCEDNAVNQQVICEHLAKIGLESVMAGNGKLGVEAWLAAMEQSRPFDVILMDIQMPVMDGLEAVGNLLKSGCKAPIIALTANVMSEDREAYLAAGMSDCLGKPFKAQELWSILLKFLTPAGFEPCPDNSGASAGLSGGNDFAKKSNCVIDRKSGLENSANDEKLYMRLQKSFFEDNVDKFKEISNAVGHGDLKLAHRMAHTLKGVAGLIGARKLQQAANVVEKSLSGPAPSAGPDDMEILEAELKAALDELGPYVNSTAGGGGETDNPGAPGNAPDRDTALALVEKLEPMLKSGSADCVDFIDEIRRVLAPLGEHCEALARQVDDYDFEPARMTLGEIKKRLEQV